MPRGHVTADGRKVARLRGEAALTQAELADMAGYGLRTIGKLESGQATTALTLAAVATVLSRRLKRAIALGDLLLQSAEPNQPQTRPEPSLLVAEQVKLLDLRRWRSYPEHPVELTDHHRFRRLPEDVKELAFHYGTTGSLLRGKCLSHPDRYEWLPASPNGHLPHWKRTCVLRLRLPGLAATTAIGRPVSAGCDIQNRVEYLDGFRSSESEWFQAIVTHPTECLTLVLLFPEGKPFRSLRGQYQSHLLEPFRTAPVQPIGMQQSRLGYWRIREPCVGETYRVEWEW